MAEKTDLASEVGSLYALRRNRATRLPQPSLRTVASLYEIALASLIPQFLSGQLPLDSLPRSIIPDFVTIIPIDADLSLVLPISDNDFWTHRMLEEFLHIKKLPDFTEPGDARRFYIEFLISDLIAKISAAYADFENIDTACSTTEVEAARHEAKLLLLSSKTRDLVGGSLDSDTSKLRTKLEKVLDMAGDLVITLLMATSSSAISFDDVLSWLPNLQSLEVSYSYNSIDYPLVLASDPMDSTNLRIPTSYAAVDGGDGFVLRSRTLDQIASSVSAIPAFPFHNIPQSHDLQKPSFKRHDTTLFNNESAVSVSSKRIGISLNDVFLIATSLKQSPPSLRNLSIIRSHLTSEQCGYLCKGIRLASGHTRSGFPGPARSDLQLLSDKASSTSRPSSSQTGLSEPGALLARDAVANNNEFFYLIRLNLSYNEIDDDACRHLAKLFVCLSAEEQAEKSKRLDDVRQSRSQTIDPPENVSEIAPSITEAPDTGLQMDQHSESSAQQLIESPTKELILKDRGASKLSPVLNAHKSIFGRKQADIQRLVLRGNFIGKMGCVWFGEALGQHGSQLVELDISGNNIDNDGLVVLANGVLRAAIKYGNMSLKMLNLDSCRIVINADVLKVLVRLISRTGLEDIILNGNKIVEPNVLNEYSGALKDALVQRLTCSVSNDQGPRPCRLWLLDCGLEQSLLREFTELNVRATEILK